MIRSESRGRRGGGGSEICPRSRVQREKKLESGGKIELKPWFSSTILPKFHYAKRRFLVTSKCRQIHEVLNVDEIKN
jgi:hypothetical protein